jgi:hypothetical protein
MPALTRDLFEASAASGRFFTGKVDPEIAFLACHTSSSRRLQHGARRKSIIKRAVATKRPDSDSRYVTSPMAQVAVSRQMFAEILSLIEVAVATELYRRQAEQLQAEQRDKPQPTQPAGSMEWLVGRQDDRPSFVEPPHMDVAGTVNLASTD